VVQAVHGRVDEHDDLHRAKTTPMRANGQGEDGLPRYDGEVPLARAGAFGYTVRVLPHSDLLPGDADLGLMKQA